MASKQFGKLRQWAGEVISVRERTAPPDEFKQLERDVELRKRGLQSLWQASEEYRAYISRKQVFDTLDAKEKLMHSEALGTVMIVHGEELGDESKFGRTLVTFGRARCQIAAIQEAFAVTLNDTFIAFLQLCLSELDDYTTLRKKLESRRLAYDAALTKYEKMKKSKEKERQEAEDEADRARDRYEEVMEEVDGKMRSIKDGERAHTARLTEFLKLERNFVGQYMDVLEQAKAEWDESFLSQTSSPLPPVPHTLNRNTSVSSNITKGHPVTEPKPSFVSRLSFRSSKSNNPHSGNKRSQNESTDSLDNSSVDKLHSERPVTPRRENDPVPASPTTTPSRSRPHSRLTRHRSDSAATTASRVLKGHTHSLSQSQERDKDEDKEKEKDKTKKGSVSGWVGDAVAGVMNRGSGGAGTTKSRKVVDKETFATLADSEDEDGSGESDKKSGRWSRRRRSVVSNHSAKSSRSHISEGGRSNSRASGRREEGSFSYTSKKVVKALYDFSGSSDELSFKAGAEIVVLNEVLDEWWLGETSDGRKGLFPSNYTTMVSTSSLPLKTSGVTGTLNATNAISGNKRRNSATGNVLGLAHLSRTGSFVSSEDDESRRTLVEGADDKAGESSDDDSGSFDGFGGGYGHERIVPVVPRGEMDIISGPRPRGGGRDVFGNDSGDETILNDSFNTTTRTAGVQRNSQVLASFAGPERHPALAGITTTRSSNQDSDPNDSFTRSPTKRAAPPPPPRRRSNVGNTGSAPPLPARNLIPGRSKSTTSVPQTFLTPGGDGENGTTGLGRSKSENNSPFESQSELDLGLAKVVNPFRRQPGLGL